MSCTAYKTQIHILYTSKICPRDLRDKLLHFQLLYFNFTRWSTYIVPWYGVTITIKFNGEELSTEPDTDGHKFGDRNSVKVKKDNITVGHVPKDISRIAKFFIAHGGEIACIITGKRQRSQLPQGGLEVPCKYVFKTKNKTMMEKLKKLLAETPVSW